MKTCFVEELVKSAADTMFQGPFRLDRMTRGVTKRGKPYMRFSLTDRTGSIVAKWWECGDIGADGSLPSVYAVVSGRIELREDGPEVSLTAAPEWMPEPDDASDYELVAPLPLAELHRRLDTHIASIEDPRLRALVEKIFSDRAFRAKFDIAPAAESMHHVFRHGLLQHTVEVTDLAVAVANVQSTWGYLPVNRDLAITGALLHDIGKIDELERGAGGAYHVGRRGYFLGHIVSGMQRVNRAMNSVPDFSPDLRDIVLHLILAHHGKREWGSPVAPALPEAQIVHLADLAGVQLFYMQEASAGAAQEFVKVWKMDNQRIFTQALAELFGQDGGEQESAPSRVREASPTLAADEPTSSAFETLDAASRRSSVLSFRTASRGDVPEFRTRSLPLLGRAAAGTPIFAEERVEEYVDVEAEGLPSDPNLYLLRVAGESMSGDGIHDGDTVIARKQGQHDPSDIVVVYLKDREEAAIKRLARRADGSIVLESSNPEVAPIDIDDPGDVQVHGKVIGVLRS